MKSELVIKLCFTCDKIYYFPSEEVKEIKELAKMESPEDEHCMICGSKLVYPIKDNHLKVKVATKLLERTQPNGNGNDKLVYTLSHLSELRFCFKCMKQKSGNYCPTKGCIGTKVKPPANNAEKVSAMSIILSAANLIGSTHYNILRAIQTVISPSG